MHRMRKERRRNRILKITVKDNGKGMEHNDIPNMLGRVLSGTKYGVRQTRGKFGLGSKMALIWSKQTTGLPIRVRSAQPGQNFVSEYVLDIDIEKNAPNVHKEEKKPNTTKWHGAELSVTIEGNWTSHRQYVLAYLRQLAIVTPYAALDFDTSPRTQPVAQRRESRHSITLCQKGGSDAAVTESDEVSPECGKREPTVGKRIVVEYEREDPEWIF